ncbi:uncharacterized protein B0I36DRAFT_89890 [Microdochium trichocladiopsis]|uniref:Uncharacterized protein n=1 Tax=Microdochium trichocladiopsis TaxID=1682393 RepID=A0A9P9BQT8_9PEZI|nr:uncharacterized protein B0I36DRAFT_89890 [Microdochium trichocladiopsis]KAH7035233.1 hypothetical protein B0I36DRAFT_89890 [Microdochium trichocladiopsis]
MALWLEAFNHSILSCTSLSLTAPKAQEPITFNLQPLPTPQARPDRLGLVPPLQHQLNQCTLGNPELFAFALLDMLACLPAPNIADHLTADNTISKHARKDVITNPFLSHYSTQHQTVPAAHTNTHAKKRNFHANTSHHAATTTTNLHKPRARGREGDTSHAVPSTTGDIKPPVPPFPFLSFDPMFTGDFYLEPGLGRGDAPIYQTVLKLPQCGRKGKKKKIGQKYLSG